MAAETDRKGRYIEELEQWEHFGKPVCILYDKGGSGMKLIFKQRLFSWFDSYDILYEAEPLPIL